jgi:hypothetical protein
MIYKKILWVADNMDDKNLHQSFQELDEKCTVLDDDLCGAEFILMHEIIRKKIYNARNLLR